MLALHQVSENSKSVKQPGIFDLLVTELLDESAQGEGLATDHVAIDLIDVPGRVPLPNDVLYKAKEVLFSHHYALALIYRGIERVSEFQKHLLQARLRFVLPEVCIISDIVNYLVHLGLVKHISRLDFALIKVILASDEQTLERDQQLHIAIGLNVETSDQ